MSLTGSFFLDGIIVLTVVAFLAVIVLWPRLTRPTPWHVAGRVGALALVNLLVLLTAATQLNASYLFFAGWGDLRGAVTGHVAQTSLHRGGGERRAASIAVTGDAASVAAHPPPLTRPVGSTGLVKYVVHGALSGLTGHVLVQLPPGYTSATREHYPVLEAFHGYPSEPLNWVKIFHIGQIVDGVVRAHELRPPVVVMPDVEIPRGVDTEGVNGPAGAPQVETWLTRDVPDWVGQHFRVVANRAAWATIGYSAGGFDAAMATILHPAQYGSGIVLGGYFRPDFGPFYEPFGPTSRLGRRYDLSQTVARQAPPVSLWVETSHADPVSYNSSARLLGATRKPTAVRAVVLQNAGHRDSVWIGLMPQALRWLGENAAGFRP
ncbi:alpha/beta hydrolase-fold protein [Nocardioides sp. CER19]|uniref:alpha/beta hydrolase n=1 Tax=Nocardioides sp. CER19 TaxID=3038538 RepID=UPI00244A8E4A|nr:alpha/beta hydrolase-fold protein [Nocardioides sp. CER19]MDH2416484.1 alpha/beta hydrolase-fold protein [Nocardioides sp. CER19]